MFRRGLMDRCWRLGSQLTGFSFGKQITHMYVHLYKKFSGTETAHYSSAKPSGGSMNYGIYLFEVDILVVLIYV